MLGLLRAVRPRTVGEGAYTCDPRANAWAGGRREWLDYVLYAADHAAPVEAGTRVLPLRDGDLDLSDHFAVWGRLVMTPR